MRTPRFLIGIAAILASPASSSVITIDLTLDLVPTIAPTFGLSATFLVPEFTLVEGDTLVVNIDFLDRQAFSASSIDAVSVSFLRNGTANTASRMRGSIRFVDVAGTLNPLLSPIVYTDPFYGSGLQVVGAAELGSDTGFARFGGVSTRFVLEDYADPGTTSRSYSFGSLLVRGTGAFVDTLPSAGAVPEPSSWALLIAGFGIVGVTARRRRPRIVAA
jgi:hypothetical protein